MSVTPRTAAQPSAGSAIVPSADEYVRLRPLLFRVLASLARQGYVVAPDEGLELVHDFFIDAWPGLQQHFDPSKGAFTTYVFAAFARYARPRIVKTQKWRERLIAVDPRELDGLPAQESPPYSAFDLVSVRRAAASLPGEDQGLLMLWLAHGSSERQVARVLRLSRYKVRQALVTALARLAAAMGEQIGSSQSDWRVVTALWVEERSVADTAAMLEMTTTQVRLARQRVFDFLASSLSNEDTRSQSSEEECHVR